MNREHSYFYQYQCSYAQYSHNKKGIGRAFKILCLCLFILIYTS